MLDGWWCEGYKNHAGWYLKEENTYENPQLQDELDAETIYSLLENKIIPEFYERDKKGIPEKWIGYIKNSIAQIAPEFNTKRMIDEYYQKFYIDLAKRHKKLCKNDFELSKKVALWKSKIIRNWNDINVVNVHTNDTSNNPLPLGANFEAEVVINLNGIAKEDVRVEVLFIKNTPDRPLEPEKIILKEDLNIRNVKGSTVTYGCSINTTIPGVFSYIFRVSPRNENLPNRMDFDLVKWIS